MHRSKTLSHSSRRDTSPKAKACSQKLYEQQSDYPETMPRSISRFPTRVSHRHRVTSIETLFHTHSSACWRRNVCLSPTNVDHRCPLRFSPLSRSNFVLNQHPSRLRRIRGTPLPPHPLQCNHQIYAANLPSLSFYAALPSHPLAGLSSSL